MMQKACAGVAAISLCMAVVMTAGACWHSHAGYFDTAIGYTIACVWSLALAFLQRGGAAR